MDTDNATVDAPEASVAETVETATPVEAAPIEDATPVEAEAPAEPIEEAPAVFDWNGELESMRDSDWLKRFNEDDQAAILTGVEAKYGHWQRGYTGKYQDIAKARRQIEIQQAETREQELRAQRWFHGDVDPMLSKQKELDEMKIAHKSALGALRREAEEAHEKALAAHGMSMQEAAEARDAAILKHTETETRLNAIEKAESDAKIDHLDKWLSTEHSHIYQSDEAFQELTDLLRAKTPPEKAVKMVYALHPAPEPEAPPAPEPEPDAVPESMKLMNMGPETVTNTEPVDNRSYAERMDAMRKEAMIENELLLRSL